jgi:hypothetical protein
MRANPKVFGATVIGFALVAGSYVINNFGESQNQPDQMGAVFAIASEPEPRLYIEVTDENEDGIEDWREEFVGVTPLIIDSTATTGPVYELPTTITDQVGIQLFQSVLQAKGRGNVGPNQDAVVADTAARLRQSIADVLYTKTDITVIASSPEAIRTYANTVGQILVNNNVPGSEDELTIIDRALRTEDPTELAKLDPIIQMYKNLRDQTMSTPVPQGFEKQHLDLINVYQAVYATLDGMTLVFTDPVVALLRVKRYQDDATGLALALQNMYTALVPYVALFNENDPAVVFVAFAPPR